MSARVPPPSLRSRPARRAPSARRPRAGRALAAPLLLALVLVAALGAGATPAPAVAQQPPGTPTPTPAPAGPPGSDPAGPPSAYTLSRSDQLFVTRSQQGPDGQGPSVYGSTYTFSSDVTRVSNSTPFADTGVPVGDPSWPLLPVRGRFTDPLHEQALVLSQANECVGPEACTYALLLGQAAGGATQRTRLAPPGAGRRRGEPGGRRRRRPGRPAQRAGLRQRRGRRRLPQPRRHPARGRDRLQRRPGGRGGHGPHGGAARHRHVARRPRLARRGGGGLRLGRPERDRRPVARRRVHGHGARVPLGPPPHHAALHQHGPGPVPRRAGGGRPPPGDAPRRLAGHRHGLPDGGGRLRRPGDQPARRVLRRPGRNIRRAGLRPGRRDVHRGPLRRRHRRLHQQGVLPGRRVQQRGRPVAAPADVRPLLVRRVQRARPEPAPAGHDGAHELDAGIRRRADAAALRRRLRRLDLRPESDPPESAPLPPGGEQLAQRGGEQAGFVRGLRRVGRRPHRLPGRRQLPGPGPESDQFGPGAVVRGRRALRAGRQQQPGQRDGQLLPHRPGHSIPACAGLTQLFQSDQEPSATAPRLLAYDPAGASLVLGAPLVFRVSRQLRPQLHPAGPPQAPGLDPPPGPPGHARQLAQRRPQRQLQPDRRADHHPGIRVADHHRQRLDDRGLGLGQRHRLHQGGPGQDRQRGRGARPQHRGRRPVRQ